MTTTIFDPAQFAPKQTETTEAVDQLQANEPKVYPVTGNSTRDSVRKFIFELFSGDNATDHEVAQLVEAIENQISNDCPDPKSKQYRDVSRAVQTKLKGQRFLELRKSLLLGEISVSEVCCEEFLSGKKQLSTKPANAPRSGAAASNPVRPNFPRGAPGQAVRPRGMAGGQIFRPPGIRPSIPTFQQAAAQNQHVQDELTLETTPAELKIEERALSYQSQAKQEQISHPAPSESIIQEQEIAQKPLQKITYEETKIEIQAHETNTPQFQSAQLEHLTETSPLHGRESFEASLDASADMIGAFDSLRPPTGKSKKTKKKKKKKLEEEEEEVKQVQVPFESETKQSTQEVREPPVEIRHSPTFEKNVIFQAETVKEQKQPEQIEETKQVITNFIQPNSEAVQQQHKVADPVPEQRVANQIQEQIIYPILETQQMQTTHSSNQNQPLQPQRQQFQAEKTLSNFTESRELKMTQNSQETRVDQLAIENQRLRSQLRQYQAREDQILTQSHQIQLLQSQLKNREEQVVMLRWQLQEQQIAHQTQIDEANMRLRNVQQESLLFRQQLSSQRQVSEPSHAVYPEYQRDQITARNQQQSVQQLQIRIEEMAADRGSNFLGSSFQHAGNQIHSGEPTENNFESGEADEGGRDDGHFYRNTTADEGTGGAGESYQQRMIDGASSGSGQMPINTAVSYQRFEQVYGTSDDVQEQNLEDDEDEEDAYPNQYFVQHENAGSQGIRRSSLQHVRPQESSSGSAFGEGNQQDDSEEGMGMGMGNRQGSGHDVEDESGSLDVVAQAVGLVQTMHKGPQNIRSNQQRKYSQEITQLTSLNANNQGEIFDAMPEETPEFDEDRICNNSVGEEGGRSEGRYEQNELEVEADDNDLYEDQNQQFDHAGQPIYTGQDEESGSNQCSGEEDSYFEKQSQLGSKQNINLVEEEEEKGDFDDRKRNSPTSITQNQRQATIIGDNVERPQPYHPRQQNRSQNMTGQQNQVLVSTGGAAVYMSQVQQNQQQNTYMQGESIQTNLVQERIPMQSQQLTNNSVGGVAVATRLRGNPPQVAKSSATPLANQLQSGERPGQPQRRGNKQQFQVPPLAPIPASSQSASNSKGQGQGGGVVGQNQSSSQTRISGRNSRGTQRNNQQQQFVATPPNQNQSQANAAQEVFSQLQNQVSRPPASQASSAAQLPLGKQNPQVSAGGATGGIQKQRLLNFSTQNDDSLAQQQQNFAPAQQNTTGNFQSSGAQSIGAISQASTMPASQASVSGSNQQRQQHNGGGSTEWYPNHQNQSAAAISHSQRQEGVVLTAQQQQFNQFQGQSLLNHNTQALGGAMMGSSGSALIGGDIGGLTERPNRIVTSNLSQMNAESGSTAEFTSTQRNHQSLTGPSFLNSQLQSQNQQFVSPPSTQAQARGGQMTSQTLLNQQQSLRHEIDNTSQSFGTDTEFFGAAVGAPPHTVTSRGAISSTQPQGNFFQGQNGRSQQIRVQNINGQQQQSLFQGGNVQKGSGSGEPDQNFTHNNALHQSQGSIQGFQNSNAGQFMYDSQGHVDEDRINHSQFQRGPTYGRNFQPQQEQTHTDSRKTSGANTPSKDGANTPSYRDRDQQTHQTQIYNLTKQDLQKKLQQVQQQQQRVTVPQEVQDAVRQTEPPSGNTRHSDQQQEEEHKVIPKNLFDE